MINVNFNLASMSGIVLAVAGTALYVLRSWRPELSRDHDIFFSAVSLLCGGILLFYGWRFDPIMQFGQVLLTGATIFFAVENIRLRKVSTEQAKRNTPIVDEERPVSRDYRVYQQAELDDLDVLVPEDEELPPRRRIRGSQDSRTSRNGYDTQIRRRPSSGRSSSSSDRFQDDPPPRKRRPRPETPSIADDWTTPNTEEEIRPRRSRPRPSTDERRPSETTSSRPSRRPPLDDDSSESFRPSKEKDKDVEAKQKGDYVDYQPIDPREEEDNSSNFDY